jgi:mRNA interferase MazF
MKDFNKWNSLKKTINFKKEEITFHESEIWWSSLGLNVGDEEDGKNENFERPILILRKFSKELFIGLPLSTKIKEGIFYINFQDLEKDYSVLLSQIRIFSSKRLIRKISKIPRGKFKKVKEALRKLLKL